jgi:oligogalacturonide lyase
VHHRAAVERRWCAMTPRFPAHSRRLVPRRAFLKNLAAVPAYLAVSRAFAAEGVAPQPASHGPVGRIVDVTSEIKDIKDPETGAHVMLLTGGGSDNVHPYFTSEAFVEGSSRIVFGSNRTGKFQLYLMDIKAKRLVQLTDGPAVHPTKGCLGTGGRLNYFDGQTLRTVNVDTLQDRELYNVPEGFDASLSTCSTKGDYLAFAYKEKTAVSTRSGVIYSDMAETFYQHPGCVIMRINTDTGEPVAVWGERNWISHVLMHPTDPNTIVFCHEGGGLVSQRMWVTAVGSPATRKARATPLFPMREKEFTVHEYFTRQGEVGFQYEVEREGKMEWFNAFIRTDGTWTREYKLPGPRPGHIQSNSDNTLIAGDRGFLSYEDKDGGNYMSLMTHGNGDAKVRRLCRMVPGPTQYSHGHPVFSRDDKWVIFNSRIGTKENIAMAEVASVMG